MTDSTCTVPYNCNVGNSVTCSTKWWLDGSEYSVLDCTYELLICGEEAFGALYRAIAKAKKSVCIICWGFQPSMYLVRNGDNQSLQVGSIVRNSGNLTIGQLLEKKASEGVKVRVLCWGDRVAIMSLATVSNEANTPNLGIGTPVFGTGIKNRNFGNTDEQYNYDGDWFKAYNRHLVQIIGTTGGFNSTQWFKRVFGNDTTLIDNLEFRMRGFDSKERRDEAFGGYDDAQYDSISKVARALYGIAPTHHQKMALIDYEDPANHVGFVMGHNMLDEYWDTRQHSYYRQAPHKGRNGKLSRQDLSARVTGPIIGDLFHNFKQAWKKEGGDNMPEADFAHYPIYAVEPGLDLCMHSCEAQLLRTQPQYGIEDIKKMYLQNIENATEYIYFENQYFRWLTLAEALKAHVARLTAGGKSPARYGNLYLFVVTNSSEEGMGAGAKKTYMMLDSLGKGDAMPTVARSQIDDDIKRNEEELNKLKEAKAEMAKQRRLDDNYGRFGKEYSEKLKRDNTWGKLEANLAKEEARQPELQRRQRELERRKAAIKKGEPIPVDPRPGLKIHICTLVPPDTPVRAKVAADIKKLDDEIEYLEQSIKKIHSYSYHYDQAQKPKLEARLAELKRQREVADTWQAPEEKVKGDIYRWPETYVHSKLMIIDDTFITTGSANINTRSMQVDSELNIIHSNHMIAIKARQDLWGMHTKGMGVQDNPPDAFRAWGDIITENKELEFQGQSPSAALRGFLRMSPSTSDKD